MSFCVVGCEWVGGGSANKFLFMSFSIYIHQPTQMMMRDIGGNRNILGESHVTINYRLQSW